MNMLSGDGIDEAQVGVEAEMKGQWKSDWTDFSFWSWLKAQFQGKCRLLFANSQESLMFLHWFKISEPAFSAADRA